MASKSSPVNPVSSRLTRTVRVGFSPPSSSSIFRTKTRASSLSGTGTESSRSKISASDPYWGALRIQSSLFPGTYIDVRNGLTFAMMASP